VSNLEHDFQTPQPNKADIISLRLKLRENGYCPVPVIGKAPPLPGWQNICKTAAEYEIRRWSRDIPDAVSTGILGGLVIGVDIDVLIPELAERIAFKCKQILGHTPLRRVGQAPKILFCYRVEAPIKKLQTPDLFLDDGGKHKVEMLADGQHFVAFGIHPDTRQPYRWGEQTPLNTPFAELPLVTVEALERFKAEAERIIREAGGLTENERKKKEAGPQPAPEAPPHKPDGITAAALEQLSPNNGGDFFRSVNDAAMRDLGRWVPDLLPAAKLQATGAWRVSSRNLRRNLQEDLSIAPTGIVDWGVADQGDSRGGKRTPIDIVIEHGGKRDAKDAALWLCDRLSIDPATLGWRGAGERKQDAGAGQSSGGQGEQEQAPPPPIIQATPYQWVNPEDVAPREWLYARHILRKFVTATAAGGATGKTTNSVVEVLVLVTGKPLLGITPAGLCRVWLWNLEDPYEEMVRKIQAACLFYGITKEDIGDRLFLNSGRDSPLVIAEPGPNGTKILRPTTDAFIKEAKANRIDVSYIDPFVSCSTVPENDNVGQDKVVKEWGRVADVCNMGVHLLDHTRKAGADEEPSVESVRGGKAKTDACRSVRVLVKMTKKEADDAGIENPRLYYRAFDGKPNLSYPVEKSEWYKLNNVSLGNGRDGKPSDEMGVVSRWTYPDTLADVTASDWDKCAAAIRASTWRAHHSSNRWVGNCIAQVMGLDVAKKADRKKVTKLISMWKAAGSLIEYEDLDERSEKRQFIRVKD
jgi:hypothetical protein